MSVAQGPASLQEAKTCCGSRCWGNDMLALFFFSLCVIWAPQHGRKQQSSWPFLLWEEWGVTVRGSSVQFSGLAAWTLDNCDSCLWLLRFIELNTRICLQSCGLKWTGKTLYSSSDLLGSVNANVNIFILKPIEFRCLSCSGFTVWFPVCCLYCRGYKLIRDFPSICWYLLKERNKEKGIKIRCEGSKSRGLALGPRRQAEI